MSFLCCVSYALQCQLVFWMAGAALRQCPDSSRSLPRSNGHDGLAGLVEFSRSNYTMT